jgi:hypothetical protein
MTVVVLVAGTTSFPHVGGACGDAGTTNMIRSDVSEFHPGSATVAVQPSAILKR